MLEFPSIRYLPLQKQCIPIFKKYAKDDLQTCHFIKSSTFIKDYLIFTCLGSLKFILTPDPPAGNTATTSKHTSSLPSPTAAILLLKTLSL